MISFANAFDPSSSAAYWRPNARVDGFSLIGASNAPGVLVNGFAHYMEVSNNKVYTNSGTYAGGIQIGHAGAAAPFSDEDAHNDNVTIHNNMVTANAGIETGGAAHNRRFTAPALEVAGGEGQEHSLSAGRLGAHGSSRWLRTSRCIGMFATSLQEPVSSRLTGCRPAPVGAKPGRQASGFAWQMDPVEAAH